MKLTKRILSIAVLVSLFGCSAFRPDKQTLNITCTVPGTVVKVNGERFDCPTKTDVRRDSKVIIEASKEGYEPFSKTIAYHLSTSAKWDAVGTVCWFFPVFGFFSPGAWDLDQTDVTIQLYPLANK